MKDLVCPHHPHAGYRLAHRWGRCECPKCGQFIGWVKPADPLLLERPACAHCGQTDSVHLIRNIQINGNSLIYWHCDDCDKRTSQALSHQSVLRYLQFIRYRRPDLTNIPTAIADIRTGYDHRASEPCFVCGSMNGTEYHHFLPFAFYDDPRVKPNWRQWDQCGVRLCRPCHELWHELVAPMTWLASVRAKNGAAK